jgi:mRNA-degrading endonuclease RelE of RelBE toxin-antitoxin system
MSSIAWTVLVAKAAQKQLARSPASDRARIVASLQSLSRDPFSGDIVKLHGTDKGWRRRVGSYRIFFAVNTLAKLVTVNAIVRRTTTTY